MPFAFAARLLLVVACAALPAAIPLAAAQAPTRPAPASAKDAGPPSLQFTVSGLEKPAEILVDQWGVAHVYARATYDAFFVQGFNAARDRLWQMDLWRRRGLGTLSEVFGPATVARDHAARLFLFRGDLYRDARHAASDRPDLYREWLAYGSDTKRIAEAFVAGINAYVKATEQNADLLPVEFRILDYKPALWSAEDLVRIRAHGAWGNVRSEVRRAQVACAAGVQADLSRRALDPAQATKVPEGLDPCDLRDDVLALYRLATSDIAFAPAVRANARGPTGTYVPPFTLVAVEPAETVAGDAELGSGIVVAGRASASGKPLIALDLSDARRVHALPAQRYAVHLSAPGLNAIGAGEPFVPGIAAGHNERIAWGATRFAIDQEDLYSEELDATGDAVKWMDRWESVEVIDESIAVRGAPPVKVTLKFTRHGPIVHEDRAKSKAYALRAGWLEVGMAPFMGSLGLMRAQGWEPFLASMNRWGGPPVNQLYADVDGNIGWKPGGLAPARRRHDGLLPAPGDSRYEWAGFFDMDQLPQEFNPARGWIALAGQPAVPAEHPLASRLGLEWSPRWRFERIAELIERTEKKTLQDLWAIQSDALSPVARRIVLQLKDVTTPDLRVAEAISLLRNWDFRLTPESPAAAFFQIWYDRHLTPAILSLRTPPAAAKLIDVADSTTILALLEQPAGRPQRDTLFVGTLRNAIADLEQRQGPNWLRWSWGALRKAELLHPLFAIQGRTTAPIPELAVRPRAGGAFTIAATPYRPSTFQATGGASFRMVFDLNNWDSSLALVAPGQSGDPRSRHYADLLEPWSKDTGFPLLWSRAAIEKATLLKIILTPAK